MSISRNVLKSMTQLQNVRETLFVLVLVDILSTLLEVITRRMKISAASSLYELLFVTESDF